ncbi:MAG: cytochrome c-type biogenesis protein CcmH [Rhodospirillaceae bacterium]|nr:cytochrome c-type biogenesis protein CcmH [Rhodospirillaceae bacterium]
MFAMFMFAAGAHAVQPDEVLKDPVLEARARELSKEIRCLVCQNQSIDDSNADLARDLRVLVRQRLTQGDSDGQVMDYLVKRYGDFVLLRPPVKASTYLLWYGPIVIFILAALGLIMFFRGRRVTSATTTAALSEDEQQRIEALLGSKNDDDR